MVDDLHVIYRTYTDRRPTLRKLVTSQGLQRSYRDVHAVRGVSLTAVPGELVGIIGPNGSGKSTLLRAITGLLPATRGAVYARARPVLLGVSAALQDALSGNDNITLGCTALGMRRSEVEDHRDRIVEFAGLGEFIDMPMRAYSSGMKARLSFAIATSVTPEILLVDEALSVGDEEFKRKSQERLDELLAAAGCIFVVSHNLGFVRDNATRVIWLDHGRIVMDGPPDDVVNSYRDRVTAQRSHDADAEHQG